MLPASLFFALLVARGADGMAPGLGRAGAPAGRARGPGRAGAGPSAYSCLAGWAIAAPRRPRPPAGSGCDARPPVPRSVPAVQRLRLSGRRAAGVRVLLLVLRARSGRARPTARGPGVGAGLGPA